MTRLLVVLLVWFLSACGAAPLKPAVAQSEEEELLIVAVADHPEPRAASGATPRLDYRRATGYAGSDRALALAAEVARDHGLSEVSAWTIDALGLRCMLYRVAAGAQRSEVLARL